MHHRRTCALLLPLTLAWPDAQAADLNARDFVTAPVGTSLGVAYLPLTRSGDYHGAGDDNGKADLSVNAFAYRQLWFSDICGTLCTPQFIVPYVDTEARLPGANEHRRERGVGDPQVGGTLFFINDPQSRTYSGLLGLLSVPVGEYHSQNPDVSPGANRWALHLNYNYTQGVGERWLLEANLEAQLYGKNDDYFGADLQQKPLYRLQAFASYDLTPTTYGALRLIHADGGELELDGRRLDDTHQRYTQAGFELGHWLDSRNQVLLGLTRNVSTDNAYAQDNLLLRFVHVF
ncbi:transporter [Pseudomonas guariconensis]|uniref:transporter n=1 Tax=Pseudomonas guariconensis TaxID=1288410 RepID=UPI0018AB8E04|nr:transporter [Pseudomonas guariconensis]MBF8729994.1 transporter [Pseudomonas guariconensis]